MNSFLLLACMLGNWSRRFLIICTCSEIVKSGSMCGVVALETAAWNTSLLSPCLIWTIKCAISLRLSMENGPFRMANSWHLNHFEPMFLCIHFDSDNSWVWHLPAPSSACMMRRLVFALVQRVIQLAISACNTQLKSWDGEGAALLDVNKMCTKNCTNQFETPCRQCDPPQEIASQKRRGRAHRGTARASGVHSQQRSTGWCLAMVFSIETNHLPLPLRVSQASDHRKPHFVHICQSWNHSNLYHQ